MPVKKTVTCITCNKRPADSGRYCSKCRYAARKASGETARYYAENREKILANRRNYHYGAVEHRRRAVAAYGAKCADCGWNKAQVVLQVHHIDSNRKNGDLTNLVLLCPTCHFYRHFLERTGVYAFYSDSVMS